MPQALSPEIRAKIISAYESSESYAAISRTLGVSYGTVRTLCKRYERDGSSGLVPRYENCGPQSIQSDALIYRAACWLKYLHRNWGADFIRLKLTQRYGARQIPTARSMQKWFRAKGYTLARSQPPHSSKVWAKVVHDVWQIDAKEQQRTADGEGASWLSIIDEHSGSLLAAPVFFLLSYL